MYFGSDGGEALGSVVHLGTFHYVILSSFCFPICYEPSSRLWKPSEIVERVISVFDDFLKICFTDKILIIKLDFLPPGDKSQN